MKWVVIVIFVSTNSHQMAVFQDVNQPFETEQDCLAHKAERVEEFMNFLRGGEVKLPFQGTYQFATECIQLKPKDEQQT